MNEPLVSVAIITYNQRDFLKECIESVMIQDYSNIEIVIADDGSTDGTHELLLEYKKNKPDMFKLSLSNVNSGITKNSNNAHFLCSGKYIAWMGGDDVMLPNKISKQVEYMEANDNCTLCYHDLDVFDSISNTTLYLFSERTTPRVGDVKAIIKYGVFNGACSTMIRVDKTPNHGFDVDIKISSDWLYWIETLASGGNIMYLNEVLGKYRRHSNNVTSTGYLPVIEEQLQTCFKVLFKYPYLAGSIRYRISEILRFRSMYEPKNYFSLLLSSFLFSFNIKSVVLLIAYIFSFGKYKRSRK